MQKEDNFAPSSNAFCRRGFSLVIFCGDKSATGKESKLSSFVMFIKGLVKSDAVEHACHLKEKLCSLSDPFLMYVQCSIYTSI